MNIAAGDTFPILPICVEKVWISGLFNSWQSLWHLKQLKSITLYFRYDVICTSIPKELAELSNLQELIVQSAKPLELIQLPASLRILDCSTCFIDLAIIPAGLKTLFLLLCTITGPNVPLETKLDMCSFHSCTGTIDKLPTDRMKRCTEFAIQNSPIPALESISYMKMLQHVSLQLVQINEFPLFLGQLPYLYHLDLSCNSMKRIDTAVFDSANNNFPSLRWFALHANPMKEHPAVITLPKLQTLYLPDASSLQKVPTINEAQLVTLVKKHLEQSRHCKPAFPGYISKIQLKLLWAIPCNENVLANLHCKCVELDEHLTEQSYDFALLSACVSNSLQTVLCMEFGSID